MKEDDDKRASSTSYWVLTTLLCCLALINSPKIVGVHVHEPRKAGPGRKLDHDVLKANGFKIHPWSEIKLEINKPAGIDDGEPHASHITGKRALHFCRKHLRLTHGKVVWVKSHWRGDPSLGVRQSHYTVTP